MEDKIKNFFKHEWIYLYEVDRRIAEKARDLIWEHTVLKPVDAVHVATALTAKVAKMETFDGKLLKLDGKIGSPALKIEHPFFPLQRELW